MNEDDFRLCVVLLLSSALAFLMALTYSIPEPQVVHFSPWTPRPDWKNDETLSSQEAKPEGRKGRVPDV